MSHKWSSSVGVAPGTVRFERRVGDAVLTVAEGKTTFTSDPSEQRRYRATVHVAVAEQSARPYVSKLELEGLDGAEVTVRAIQALQLGELLGAAKRGAVGVVDGGTLSGRRLRPAEFFRLMRTGGLGVPTAAQRRAAVRGLRPTDDRRALSRTPSVLRAAAVAHRAAPWGSRSAAVMEATGATSEAVARKLIEKCRNELDPSTGTPYLPPSGRRSQLHTPRG